jgi:2'-5' RNA ligase
VSEKSGPANGAAEKPPSQLRLFAALPVPEAAEVPLREAQAALKRKAQRSRLAPRWTDPEQLHLTLKFLGYTAAERLPELEAAILEEAKLSHPIQTSWAGLGAFPGPKRARVLIARLSDVRAELLALYSRLEASFDSLGFPFEERAFIPHVTLARIKTPGDVQKWLDATALPETSFELDTLRLYRSTLRPTGAIYDVVVEARLGV